MRGFVGSWGVPGVDGVVGVVIVRFDLVVYVEARMITSVVAGVFIDGAVAAKPTNPGFNVPCRDNDGYGIVISNRFGAGVAESFQEFAAATKDAFVIAVDNDEKSNHFMAMASGSPLPDGLDEVIEYILGSILAGAWRNAEPHMAFADTKAFGEIFDKRLRPQIFAQDAKSTESAFHLRPHRSKVGTTIQRPACRQWSRALLRS